MSEEIWTELDKIDEIRERMGVSYEEAKQALTTAQGDVIKALIDLEKNSMGNNIKDKGEEVFTKVRSTMENLNHTRVNIRKNNRKVLSVSAPVGLALAYSIWKNRGLRLLGMMGIAGALWNHFDLELEKPNHEVEFYDVEPEAFVYKDDNEDVQI